MFAPPITKTKTKPAELKRATSVPQRPIQSTVDQVHRLQRTIGNQAMLRLLAQHASVARSNEPGPSENPAPLSGGIQAKLKVGAVNDPLEHEADRVANQVMHMPARQFSIAATPPQLSRKCAACEEEDKLQKKPAGPQSAAGEAPAIVHEVLRSPGQQLDASTRAFFEPRFGHDFSAVRVHTGVLAEQSAQDMNASAYTLGHDIVFGAGRFVPRTPGGRWLIAHELAHVVQQSNADRIRVGQSNEKRGLSPVSTARFVDPALVQRACGEKQIGEMAIEPDGVYKKDLGDPGVEGTLVRFRVGCDEFLTPEDEARLRGLAGRSPWRTRIVIHGFASEEGSPTFNQMLSLARAAKARTILSRLMDPAQIERVIWHGSVPGNRADRRSVIIQTESPLPPVTKTLTIVSWINGGYPT
jgi:outer membrane protein OmpA-like peptidoglycan-associated protein